MHIRRIDTTIQVILIINNNQGVKFNELQSFEF